MGWGAVWRAAAVQFAAEPVEVRIAVILAVALATLLILIGLRHAFRPAGPKAVALVPDLPARSYAAVPLPPAKNAETPKPVSQPLRIPTLSPRKSAKRTVNRQRAVRPQIRRAR